jgi:pimeloyl-ACP methyl ester carboxylesterase
VTGHVSRARVLPVAGVAALLALVLPGREAAGKSLRASATKANATASVKSAARRVRMVTIHFRAHDGRRNTAYVLLPAWYGPGHNPRIPLIISPHGRGLDGRANAAIWGGLPARGPFVVVNPDARGRRLPRYSWGYRGQIDDLARMPEILRLTLPWLRVDRTRIYAFGGSMGGQETLLLLARHPRLLAGAAAFDAVADFRLQYRGFRLLACRGGCRLAWKKSEAFGRDLQKRARLEIGGSPKTTPARYAERSPLFYARRISRSCVPLQLWWSVADQVVRDQRQQSARLFWELRRLNEHAPVSAFTGFWIHSAEMRAKSLLPIALAEFGLLPRPTGEPVLPVRAVPVPPESYACRLGS